jgi:hypothetical protein
MTRRRMPTAEFRRLYPNLPNVDESCWESPIFSDLEQAGVVKLDVGPPYNVPAHVTILDELELARVNAMVMLLDVEP